MTKEEFIKFVESWDWTFSKTYAKKSPHEYIVCKANHPRRAEYEKAVQFIRENGEPEKYFRATFTVYKVNGHKYWTGNKPMSGEWILNRSLKGEPDRVYGDLSFCNPDCS